MNMEKIRNNYGFSMVELLAAVAILGVLAAIAVVSVGTVLENAEEKHYETQEKNMIMAAQSYVQDNRNLLPKRVGDSRVVTLQELQNAKYIGDVVDRSKKNCSEGTVTVFRYSKEGYSYTAYLKCGSKVIGSQSSEIKGPIINLNASQADNNYKNAYFTYSILPNSENDGEIVSYNYQIFKDTVLVYDSGSISVSRASSIENKKVSLKTYVPGNLKIVFSATNHLGGTTSAKIESKNYQDPDGPECGEVTPKRSDWANLDEVVISITCIDNSGSGCARDIFTQHFTTDSEINSIEIVNNLGKKTSCPVDTYIDKTPPDKPIITNTYENTWINQNYTLKLKSNDKTSGIEYFQYRYPNSVIESEKNWTNYETSKREGDSLTSGDYTYTTPVINTERNEIIEIRACDQAGNCSDAAQSIIKIDKTAPSCTISRNIPNPDGASGWYISEVVVSLNPNDPVGSGQTAKKSPLYYALTTGGETYSSNPLSGALSKTQGDTSSSGVLYKGYIKDEAGNKASCQDASKIYIDTTPFVSQSFGYTGAVQTFTAPYSGTYKLEVWGAAGGTASGQRGGYGGYATGKVYLTAGQVLYVAVGGKGSSGHPTGYVSGGWNGGGGVNASSDHPTNRYVAGGGGATHIAKNNNRGVLSNYASYTSEILIVAGGGGGGYYHTTSGYYGVGGHGGGTTGGNGTYANGCCQGLGGSQSGPGYANGHSSTAKGGFGYGGTVGHQSHGSGGGGGWYGGGGSYGTSGSSNSSGGGGSSYTGGVTGGSTTAGSRNDHGYATISNAA